MNRIKNITFISHPILKDLSIDFCDIDGNPVDTVIIAGENGSGKSTVLDCLYKIASRTVDFEAIVDFENNSESFTMSYKYKTLNHGSTYLYASDGSGLNAMIGSSDVANKRPSCGIFSEVNINFNAQDVSSVTSMTLDAADNSRRSDTNLPTQINQLLIDIQALDDADLAYAYREAKAAGNPVSEIEYKERMPRFTKAFNQMFDGLTYSRIENQKGHKSILFQKNGVDIPISGLSSGEKQIVYRGCFLLKDANAMNGAFVFIDEPEISLHPTWQKKIMDYYKGIFTDANGQQTSQIFAVTHSPFVIHNENRRNDKVIVIERDKDDNIIVKDKPEYLKCTSMEAVQDAFSIREFSAEKSTIYLEGRTDEKYFNKALEIYKDSVPFQFKWVGYLNDNGQEENTGKDALNKAVQFLIAQNLTIKNVCLFDCDTNHPETDKNNVYTRVIPTYSTKCMKKGIENALILDSVDVKPFYSSKIKPGDYGDDNTIVEFKKMEFCNNICAMNEEMQKTIFANLKSIIDLLISLFVE